MVQQFGRDVLLRKRANVEFSKRSVMGKSGKSHRRQQKAGRGLVGADDGEDVLPSSAYEQVNREKNRDERETDETEERCDTGEEIGGGDLPSKFHLYQLSVQRPKGDVSYMQKFFLMYIGGRMPLHLQEDFCGTALLSIEWMRSHPRRTAMGLDLDLEALTWCLENNMDRIGADGFSRISLFHGNVLCPEKAILVKPKAQELFSLLSLGDSLSNESSLPQMDIICAFNYSCCCLHNRSDLVRYFKHVLRGLSKQGGIFVMDLYGGTSSECSLKFQKKFPGFTYTWEQQEFDILSRMTRISLHFQVSKRKILRHAFSYKWRLWSLPEVHDCLKEAGFSSVHFWMKEMPESLMASEDSSNVKYEEMTSFQQIDSWNSYVVGVIPPLLPTTSDST